MHMTSDLMRRLDTHLAQGLIREQAMLSLFQTHDFAASFCEPPPAVMWVTHRMKPHVWPALLLFGLLSWSASQRINHSYFWLKHVTFSCLTRVHPRRKLVLSQSSHPTGSLLQVRLSSSWRQERLWSVLECCPQSWISCARVHTRRLLCAPLCSWE